MSAVSGTGPGAEKVLTKYYWLNEYNRDTGRGLNKAFSRESPSKTRKQLCYNKHMIRKFRGKKQCSQVRIKISLMTFVK